MANKLIPVCENCGRSDGVHNLNGFCYDIIPEPTGEDSKEFRDKYLGIWPAPEPQAPDAIEVDAPFDDGKGKPEPNQHPYGADYVTHLHEALKAEIAAKNHAQSELARVTGYWEERVVQLLEAEKELKVMRIAAERLALDGFRAKTIAAYGGIEGFLKVYIEAARKETQNGE